MTVHPPHDLTTVCSNPALERFTVPGGWLYRTTASFGSSYSVALAFVPEPVSASTIADRVVQDVCDLPDRNSPDDWPEAMLVTGEELHRIVMDTVEQGTGATPC